MRRLLLVLALTGCRNAPPAEAPTAPSRPAITCAPGQIVTGIHEDGTPSCADLAAVLATATTGDTGPALRAALRAALGEPPSRPPAPVRARPAPPIRRPPAPPKRTSEHSLPADPGNVLVEATWAQSPRVGAERAAAGTPEGQHGIRLTRVAAGSLALALGLQEGDLVEVLHAPAPGAAVLNQVVADLAARGASQLRLRRAGARPTLLTVWGVDDATWPRISQRTDVKLAALLARGHIRHPFARTVAPGRTRIDREGLSAWTPPGARTFTAEVRLSPPAVGQTGLLVREIRTSGLFFAAGLRRGDLVETLGGARVETAAAAAKALEASIASGRTEIRLSRRGRPETLTWEWTSTAAFLAP